MSKRTQPVDLPVEAFALLIRAAAQGIVNQLNGPIALVDITYLHGQVGILDELVGKFELLHEGEQTDVE